MSNQKLVEKLNGRETTTKSKLLEHFKNQEFVQINFPEMDEDEPIYLRSEIQDLDHFNTVYRDGSKVYLEDSTDTLIRLSQRIFGEKVYDSIIWERIGFCLYYAGYEFKKARRIYKDRY